MRTVTYSLPIKGCEGFASAIHQNLATLSCVTRIDTDLMKKVIHVYIEDSEKGRNQMCAALIKMAYMDIEEN